MISKSELQRGVERLAVESGGLLEIIGIRKADIPLLFADALSGCPESQGLLKAVLHTLSKIERAPKGRPMLCASCPESLLDDNKFAVVVVRGAVKDPCQALTLAVCGRCGPTPGAIKASAAVGLRGLFPDARPCEPTHTVGGHA